MTQTSLDNAAQELTRNRAVAESEE